MSLLTDILDQMCCLDSKLDALEARLDILEDVSTYIQSDNTKFFQPDGSSLYLIP
jgi:hypothetical protein